MLMYPSEYCSHRGDIVICRLCLQRDGRFNSRSLSGLRISKTRHDSGSMLKANELLVMVIVRVLGYAVSGVHEPHKSHAFAEHFRGDVSHTQLRPRGTDISALRPCPKR